MCWQMHLVRMLGPELGKKLLQVGNEVTDLIVGDRRRQAGATRLMLLPRSRPSSRHHSCYVVCTESRVRVKVEEEGGSGERETGQRGTEGKRSLVRESTAEEIKLSEVELVGSLCTQEGNLLE